MSVEYNFTMNFLNIKEKEIYTLEYDNKTYQIEKNIQIKDKCSNE